MVYLVYCKFLSKTKSAILNIVTITFSQDNLVKTLSNRPMPDRVRGLSISRKGRNLFSSPESFSPL